MSKGERLRTERRLEQQHAAEAENLNRRTRREAARRGAEEGELRGCLFCRRTDGGFTSEEHIIPEGLGNTEHVLPVGVVCDRCNHGVLSEVDKALMTFLPIEQLRTWHGIPSKSGKLPEARFDNGRLRCVGPGELHLSLDSHKGQPEAFPDPPGKTSFSFSATRNDTTSPRRLRAIQRALLKMAIEFAWLDLGESEALGPHFDHVRERVLVGCHTGYLAFPKRVVPDQLLEVRYELGHRASDRHPLVGVLATFCGFLLTTDSLFSEPSIGAPRDWLLHPFTATP